MRNFLETVRSRYDYVIIDAPPVLPVTDAQILSPLADITLAVIEPCRVPEKAAMQMVESLQSIGATISGMVINDRMGRGFRYYGSYSYYGNKNYSGYYGENPDDLADGPITRTAKKIWAKLNY
jgi:Mrp family chromosome partitioning ATPase